MLVFLLDGTWNLSELALGGSVAGVVVAVVINPLDVVATRLYNQPDKVFIEKF